MSDRNLLDSYITSLFGSMSWGCMFFVTLVTIIAGLLLCLQSFVIIPSTATNKYALNNETDSNQEKLHATQPAGQRTESSVIAFNGSIGSHKGQLTNTTNDTSRISEISDVTEGASVSSVAVHWFDKIETFKRYIDILTRRSDWSAKNVTRNCTERLEYPILNIYIAASDFNNCYSREQCKSTVRTLEEKYTYRLRFNFFIGGDGTIFEGLSWSCKMGSHLIDFKSIVVMFAGRLDDEDTEYGITNEQNASLQLFIKANLISGSLSPSYQFLPYCYR